MANLERASPGEIVLVIGNKKPIAADELGKLFQVMAKDYRRLTRGRTLVIARVSPGSTLIWLQDAALIAGAYAHNLDEISKAIGATRYFAENLSALWRYLKGDASHSTMRVGPQTPGLKTVEKLAEMAADSKSKIDYEYEGPDGEKIRLKMTPQAARAMRSRRVRHVPRIEASAAPKQISSVLKGLDLTQPDSSAAVTEALAQLPNTSNAREIAAVVASVLRSANLEYVLERIISDLALRGLNAIAEALRYETLAPQPQPAQVVVTRE